MTVYTNYYRDDSHRGGEPERVVGDCSAIIGRRALAEV